MTSEEYIGRLRHLRWLKDIATDYTKHLNLMKAEGEHYNIEAIHWSARGEGRVFQLNPHRPIDHNVFYDALNEALWNLNAEIGQLEAELKSVTVTL